jgi:two-component system sensor kinase FixL
MADDRLQLAIKSVRMAFWEWDFTTGTLTYLNSYQDLFGIVGPLGPLNDQEALKLVAEEEHNIIREAAIRTFQSGDDFQCEFRCGLPHDDGFPRWFASFGQLERDVTGRPGRILGVTWEISKRMRAEQALRASEAEARMLSMVASRTHNAVILADAEGRIEWVNDGFTRITGYVLDEVYGRTPGSFLQGPQSDPQLCDAMRQAVREEREFTAEILNYHKSGRTYWVAIEAKPIHDEAGRLTHFMAIESDITERKRGEQALQQLNEQLEQRVQERTLELLKVNEVLRIQIAERKQIEDDLRTHSQVLLAISEAVCFVDDQGFIRFTNRALDVMFGYEPGELIGLPVITLNDATPEDNRRSVAEVMSSINAIGVWAGEFRNRRKDGTVFWGAVRISKVTIDGVVRFVSVQRDITDHKKSEEQMELLRKQLAHASRLGTLGEMAAGLAHELNQPLAALRLYATAAKDLGPAFDSQDLRECLQRIDEQSLRAGEIIRRMRSFVSRHPFRREPADLNQLLREVLAILQNELRHSRVSTELNLDDDLPAVSVDTIQIQQILVNLIRNAVEAMTQPGNNSRQLSIRTNLDGNSVRVGIADTGGGLDPAVSAKLFEPFQSTKPTGLGLGLAICRTLVEAHGGCIGVEPNSTRGTTFFFSLPAVKDQSAS